MQKGLLFCFFVCFSLFAAAQSVTIKDSAVQITEVKITVKANAFSAETKVEIELLNPAPKLLDGELSFSLADGQTVNGFQLDVNGKMRDGVVVEKQKARVAYENIVRRRVDPGLLEMNGANRYRIRVYPVPANGKQRITFSVHQLLVPNGRRLDYLFPLDFSVTPRKLRAGISVTGEASPVVLQGLLKGQTFDRQGAHYQCNYQTQTVATNATLAFSIPLQQTASICAVDDDCGTAFFARVTPDSLRLPATTLQNLTMFWDVSASASGRNGQSELQFLEQYLRLRQPQVLRVVTFAIEPLDVKTFAAPASSFRSVKAFLASQKPDGGTRLSSLRCADYPADEYLLFSDRHNTFGGGSIVGNGKPIFCIQSTPSANTALLKQLASATAGKLLDLTGLTPEQAVENTQQAEWNFIASTEEQKRLDLQWRKVGDAFFLAGKSQQRLDTLWLHFGYGPHQQRIPLQLDATACDGEAISKATVLLRAQNRTESNEEAMQDFATEHGLVTANTSLIVLDALEDYHQYGINPPTDLLDEFKKRFPLQPDRKSERKKDEEIFVYEKLRSAVDEYNQRLKWWDPQLSPLTVKSPEQKRREATVAANGNAQPPTANPASNNTIGAKSNALSEVVVIGYGARRRANITGSVSTVSGSQLFAQASVQTALAGRVAGLNVTASQPGASASVQVRGLASIRGGGEPLYVVDGVRTDAATAMNMSTFDIESISVLKDAASSALYGGGANGVIVITTKKGQFAPGRPHQQEEQDEDDCTDSLNELAKTLRYDAYLEIRQRKADEPAFYFEMADYFFRQKQAEEALRIISNLAEMRAEDHQLLRTVGYALEEWGYYTDAVDVYKAVLRIKEEEPQSYRDLALAHAMAGNRSEAVRLLYSVLTKEWGAYETRYRGLREIMMTELNVLMAGQQPEAFGVEKAALQAAPVDLRVVIDWNKDETDIDLHVVEPGGEECYYGHRTTKNGGRITNDFTQGYGPENYEIRKAVKGTYKVRINYYGDRYQKQQTPSFVKLSVFKNYGKPGQTVFIKTIKLESSEQIVDLAEIKF